MKVLILSVADLRHMTPSITYRKYFEEKGIDYHIICTQRYKENNNVTVNNNIHRFQWIAPTTRNRIKKVIPFLKFRKYAINLIYREKYDYIVVWNENTATLFADFLALRYSNRFCINVRDILSDLGPFRNIFMIAARYADFTTTPTPKGYTELKNNYVLYNYDTSVISKSKVHNSFKKPGERITLTYMGLAKTSLQNFKRIIELFGNDDRYILQFFGDSCDTLLVDYAKKKNINNIICGGAFAPEKTADYLNNTDIIINYYNSGHPCLKITIGIKASYGPPLRIPQITDANTYWASVCEKYGFGFPVIDESTIADDLYTWYHSLDFSMFDDGCRQYCEFINTENKKFYEKCDSIFTTK
jgi:hypothetical protein